MEKSPRLKSLVYGVVLSVVLATIGYPLSIGPVEWLQSRNAIAGYSWCELEMYRPLAATYGRFPAVTHVLDWYVSLWTPYRTHGGVI